MLMFYQNGFAVFVLPAISLIESLLSNPAVFNIYLAFQSHIFQLTFWEMNGDSSLYSFKESLYALLPFSEFRLISQSKQVYRNARGLFQPQNKRADLSTDWFHKLMSKTAAIRLATLD